MESNNWLIYLLFIVAGLLVGGVWSAYQAGNKLLTIVLAVFAAVALTGAVLWMLGAMT
ncbi:hypothetical protein HCH15_09815 [Corynebacterium testudinoris]|uniref:Uncharacterized protein n=1 Tax=Corynebacterium testudinoris TaxID=136857 RepID=A0A0G3H720_9CORY|nr:hypothetical protein [Corynebacterium testudinoris]AKK09171.1 hypothetical protein CTEST_08705 [Corynebacterium testudinoris]MBX8996473.1 hypothetical protein [Corynebacterium testudinoris]